MEAFACLLDADDGGVGRGQKRLNYPRLFCISFILPRLLLSHIQPDIILCAKEILEPPHHVCLYPIYVHLVALCFMHLLDYFPSYLFLSFVNEKKGLTVLMVSFIDRGPKCIPPEIKFCYFRRYKEST